MVGSPGYNINQDYLGGPQTISVNTPSGCTTGAAGCVTTEQEVIGFTDSGGVISKGPSTSSWMAWVPTLTTLNQDGNAYQPYTAGIPSTLQGGSVVKWNPTDMQALDYLDSAPGAGAIDAYQKRTCNPLWSNVFGCKEGDDIWVSNEKVAQHDSFFGKLKKLFGAEGDSKDTKWVAPVVGIVATGLVYVGVKKLF
jgi:hypothetical protein